MQYPTFLALVIGATLSGHALANDSHRQHEAHVHGQVELNIAQDGDDLLLEITAPGADVVGFEHAPQDEAQHKRLKQALETLHHPNDLFVMSKQAQCVMHEVFIKHNLGQDEHHDHHSHSEGDDHQDHDHAEHDHSHHDHKAEKHADEHPHGTFTAQYQYQCATIEELKLIDIQWFRYFPTTEKIQANVLTDKQQTALQLNAKQTQIKL